MSRSASVGILLSGLAMWLVPTQASHAQPSCGNWVCFEDVTNTNLLVTSGSLPDGTSDEMDAAAGDVDNDGDIDLVAVYKQLGTTTGKRRNFLFLNEGGVLVDYTNEFASSASGVDGDQGFLTPTNDRDVALADVDGNGFLDIITATTRSGGSGGTAGIKHISHPRIYINLGNDVGGNWLGFDYDDVDRVPTLPAEPRFCSVSAGDLDNDGDMDLYLGDYQQPTNVPRPVDLNDRMWINDGTGYFSDESSSRMTATMLESSFAMATVIADMNGDGRLDILKDDALNAPQGVSISYNNVNNSMGADGMFSDYELPYLHAPYHVNVGDLNQDGDLDLVLTDDGQDSFIYQTGVGGDGLSNFSSRETLGGAPGQFDGNNLIADLDKDGWGDVLIANMDVDLPDTSCTQRGRIYHNNGGTIGGAVTISHQGDLGITLNAYRGGHDFIAEDFNGDGWLDLFVGSCQGTWLYFNQPPFGVEVAYPDGRPEVVNPDEPYTFTVDITAFGGDPAADGHKMRVSIDGGAFDTVPLTPLGGTLFEAELPSSACEVVLDYYIEVEFESELVFTDPPDAPLNSYRAVSGFLETTYQENVESSTSEWSVLNDDLLETGAWEPATPIGTLWDGELAAPAEAAEGSMSFVTENCAAPGCSAGTADIDGGGTELISQVFDLAGADAEFTYDMWFYNSNSDAEDSLSVWVTNEANAVEPLWVLADSTTGTASSWVESGFRVSDFVTPTSEVAVRFRAEDVAPGSITEAGLDNIKLNQVVCEACSTNHCCDLDGNGIRDDGCVWCECDASPCGNLLQQIPIVFADMGGSNGDCLPDGVADANDRFHAINCFSNQDTAGNPGYGCETAPPAAYNVDAAGASTPCSPDGVCDANDAFAALNAFQNQTDCTCPGGGPAPSFPGEREMVGHASITLSAGDSAAAGELIRVEAILDGGLDDLRGYQLHVGVDGGRRGTLELVDIMVENRRDTAFAGQGAWRAFNVDSGQMLAGLDGQGLQMHGGSYLATFVFRASKDAAGSFVVDLRHDRNLTTDRTILFGSNDGLVALDATTPAVITLQNSKGPRLSSR